MNLIRSYLTQNPCYAANINKADSRYTTFQQRGPLGLMLHSVGCAQPSANVFVKSWNKSSYDWACVHAFIDADDGKVYQTLPWNYRGWHAGGSANDSYVGVEMCESKYIKYIPNNAAKFEILDEAKARADCKRCYNSAVELFASICKQYGLNPLTAICSHKEGYEKGVASDHGDPEHYWKGLGMSYTMDGFRRAVKKEMEGEIDMTREELNALFEEKISKAKQELTNECRTQITNSCKTLSSQYSKSLEAALVSMANNNENILESRIGKQIVHATDIPWASVRTEMQKLLDMDVINGGTSKEVDPNDIRLPLEMVRVLVVCARYSEILIDQLRVELGLTSTQTPTEA